MQAALGLGMFESFKGVQMHKNGKTFKRWLVTGVSLVISLVSIPQMVWAQKDKIAINQLGYLPLGAKIAVVPSTQSGEFWLMSAGTDAEVLRGPLSKAVSSPEFNGKTKIADFSAFNKPGDYYLRVTGVGRSEVFSIGEGRYDTALRDVARTFYLHRASAPIEKTLAGQYARPAGHPDLLVYTHNGAGDPRNTRLIASPRGWYDSGDYNKYTVNSAFALYFLLRTFHLRGDNLAKLDLDIPESTNTTADLQDEILWGLDWLLTMQDRDGGVYQRLGGVEQDLQGPPSSQYDRRYLMQKSTAATLHFAAVSAYASAVLASSSNARPELSDALRSAAEKAWGWAKKNPEVVFSQPPGVSSELYAWTNDDLVDEWSWAAAELAAATGKKAYLKSVKLNTAPRSLRWQHVEVLALLSVINNSQVKQTARQQAQQKLQNLSDEYVRQYWKSGYLTPLEKDDFERGSNYLAINKAFTLLETHRLVERAEYLDGARAILDYLMGRNPLGVSYITGVGRNAPANPRDWVSRFDSVKPAVPGMLVGGPFSQANDDCKYLSTAAASRYLDDWCSSQTNQVSLSGSAALLYALSKLREEPKPRR